MLARFNFNRESLTRSLLRREWLLALAIVVGACLRLYQIGDQIAADDEWHAIHAARDGSYASIAVHFNESDVSIPLTLFYKVCMDTFGLSELVLRFPILIFGLLSLAVFPLLIRLICGRTTATLFAWLLAISPIHIYFSRYARPYAIVLFFSFVGIFGCYLWWTTGDRRWKIVYAVCAVLGPYFHLSILPLLCTPLILLGTIRLFPRSFEPSISAKDLRGLLLFIVSGLAILLLPPICVDFGSLADKASHGRMTLVGFTDAFKLLLGTDARWFQSTILVIIALGAVHLLTKQFRLALFLCATGAVPLVVIAVLRPVAIERPIVIARYSLFLLPVLLFALAAGLRTLGGWLGAAFKPTAALFFIAWILISLDRGPLRRTYYAPNNWTNHAVFQYFPYMDSQQNPYTQILDRRKSSFYSHLGSQPVASLRILEAPWYFEWHYNPYPFYQQVHRQKTAIGFVKNESVPYGEIALSDRRFRFRNFVHLLDSARICEAGIDRVVVHKNLPAELSRSIERTFTAEIPALIIHYRRFYGAPVFEDDLLVVFDVTPHCYPNR